MWVTFYFPVCPIVDGVVVYGEAFCVPDLSTAPKLEAEELMTVLLGMLGLGGMRSYEKKHGVSREK
jgi:hypothetical protein